MAKDPGFAEGQAKYHAPPVREQRWKLKIGADGRVVIPAAARALMMLDEDGMVTAYVEDGELRMISSQAAICRIQKIAAKYRREGHSVVDELIAERREAAAKGD